MAKRQPPVTRNMVLELDIDALNSDGQGVARKEGYAIFIPGALPGERVEATIIKPGAGYGIAKLNAVVHPAPQRTIPPCPLFGRCGGCELQHMDYAAQLAFKRQVVQDAFGRIGGMTGIVVPETLGMEIPWAYRNKGSFPVQQVNGVAEVGFFAQRSHRIVPMDECPIQRPPLMQAARCVRDWANAHGIVPYQEESGTGLLRHVVVRVGSSGEVMVTLVLTSSPPQKEALLQSLREGVEGLCSVYLNINDVQTNVILGNTYHLLWGDAQITEELEGLSFSVGPASFLQVNTAQTRKLYQLGLDFLGLTGKERVLDAYCGIGTITLLLAQRAREAVGVEYVQEAVDDAKQNAVRNGISNARFIAGEAEQLLPRLLREGYAPDAIVMDPPRKGAERAFLQAVVESNVNRVLYISCDPGTLARDCKYLCGGGYALARVQPVDMFAQGKGVETVALLAKQV